MIVHADGSLAGQSSNLAAAYEAASRGAVREYDVVTVKMSSSFHALAVDENCMTTEPRKASEHRGSIERGIPVEATVLGPSQRILIHVTAPRMITISDD